MVTLYAAHKLDGTLIGRCDANCYEATEPECDCICGGANHGKGIEKAVDITIERADEWAAGVVRKHGPAHCEGQLALF